MRARGGGAGVYRDHGVTISREAAAAGVMFALALFVLWRGWRAWRAGTITIAGITCRRGDADGGRQYRWGLATMLALASFCLAYALLLAPRN